MLCFHLKAFACEVFIIPESSNSMNIKERTVGRFSSHLFYLFIFPPGEPVMHFHMLEHFLVRFPHVRRGGLLTIGGGL